MRSREGEVCHEDITHHSADCTPQHVHGNNNRKRRLSACGSLPHVTRKASVIRGIVSDFSQRNMRLGCPAVLDEHKDHAMTGVRHVSVRQEGGHSPGQHTVLDTTGATCLLDETERNDSSASAKRIVVNFTTEEPERVTRSNDHGHFVTQWCWRCQTRHAGSCKTTTKRRWWKRRQREMTAQQRKSQW